MPGYNRYKIIAADTLEARKHQRKIIEENLARANLPEALREQLQSEYRRAVTNEKFAREELYKEEDIEAEEERKKKRDASGKGEGGDAGGSGSAGSSGSGSASGGGGGGMNMETVGEDADLFDLEVFALMFFMAEQSALTLAADEATGAATLMYNRDEQTAHIHEPYMGEAADAGHSPAEFLPSIEQHAADMGAHTLHVDVHANAVELFRNKFGYVPLGNAMRRGGVPMQRMRKVLVQSPAPLNQPV